MPVPQEIICIAGQILYTGTAIEWLVLALTKGGCGCGSTCPPFLFHQRPYAVEFFRVSSPRDLSSARF